MQRADRGRNTCVEAGAAVQDEQRGGGRGGRGELPAQRRLPQPQELQTLPRQGEEQGGLALHHRERVGSRLKSLWWRVEETCADNLNGSFD